MKRARRVATRSMAVAAITFLLSGCLRLTMDLEVAENDTVSGSAVFAVEREALELAGTTFEDAFGNETLASGIEGVSFEPYEDGGFVGREITFDAVSLEDFNQGTVEDSIAIVRQGDTFRVNGSLDLSLDDVPTEGAPFDPQEMLERADIRITLSFPGEVESSNGEIDGNSVTWVPQVGERTEFVAVASAVGGGSSNLLMVVLIAIVIGVVAAVALVTMRRKPVPGTPIDVATPGAVPPPTDPAEVVPAQREPSDVVPPQPAPSDVVPPQPAPEPEPPPEPPAAPGERPPR